MRKINFKNYFTNSIIFAAVCIVWKDRRKKSLALLLRPKNEYHHLAGRWFFPGGGIEAGEKPALAAIRETKEEIGIKAEGLYFIDICTYREFWIDKSGKPRNQDIVLFVYGGFFAGGKLLTTKEAVNVQWIFKKDLRKFIDSDIIKSHLSSKKVKIALSLASTHKNFNKY